jgi:hypothetical protein
MSRSRDSVVDKSFFVNVPVIFFSQSQESTQAALFTAGYDEFRFEIPTSHQWSPKHTLQQMLVTLSFSPRWMGGETTNDVCSSEQADMVRLSYSTCHCQE